MRHRVLVDDPNPKSHAALVMLAKRLSQAEEGLAEWLAFRLKFLGKFPELVCSHCGKKGLLKETENTDMLATVDHVVPVSKGGPKFDESNCLVACFPCNNNRKDLDLDEYRRRKGLTCKSHTT